MYIRTTYLNVEAIRRLTTTARTISPGRKLSKILTLSFSVALTSCTRINPCHSPSRTVSPTTRIATEACFVVILVTLQRTVLLTSGRTSALVLLKPSLVWLSLPADGLLWIDIVGNGATAVGVIFVRRFCGPTGLGGMVVMTGPRIEA